MIQNPVIYNTQFELPSEYTQQEYITLDYTSYIYLDDLSDKTAYSLGVLMDVDLHLQSDGSLPLFGRYGNGANYYLRTDPTNNIWIASLGSSDMRNTTLSTTSGRQIIVMRKSSNNTTNTGEEIIIINRNKNSWTYLYYLRYLTYFYIGSIGLLSGVTYAGNMDLYHFKLYRENELTHDLVPCIRNSDGKMGMYNLITSSFYLRSDQ